MNIHHHYDQLHITEREFVDAVFADIFHDAKEHAIPLSGMSARVFQFPPRLAAWEREKIRRFLYGETASTDPADYPGQDVSSSAVNWDGRIPRREDG